MRATVRPTFGKCKDPNCPCNGGGLGLWTWLLGILLGAVLGVILAEVIYRSFH